MALGTEVYLPNVSDALMNYDSKVATINKRMDTIGTACNSLNDRLGAIDTAYSTLLAENPTSSLLGKTVYDSSIKLRKEKKNLRRIREKREKESHKLTVDTQKDVDGADKHESQVRVVTICKLRMTVFGAVF